MIKINRRAFIGNIFAGFITVFWAGTLSAAVAEDAIFAQRIQVEKAGIYQPLELPQSVFKADTTAGYASVLSTRFLHATHRIPLQKKTIFGFNYSISETSVDAEWVPVSIKVTHPETADYLGNVSTGFTQLSAARLKADGRYHNSALYIFSESYEMVPGDWTITVIYDNQISASQTFYVHDTQIDVASSCCDS
ncbi:MAG: DUF3859 domain-containing protein [Spongiibacteraceae bacterium]